MEETALQYCQRLIDLITLGDKDISIKQRLIHLKNKIEDESRPVQAGVKPANGGLDYDFIVRVMLSMTEYPDMLPENIRTEKAKLSKRYQELYDKKEPHILARIEWLKNYIESRLSV